MRVAGFDRQCLSHFAFGFFGPVQGQRNHRDVAATIGIGFRARAGSRVSSNWCIREIQFVRASIKMAPRFVCASLKSGSMRMAVSRRFSATSALPTAVALIAASTS